ncbi:MAG: hypothetical protein JSV09_13105 [Thermoplasmata archaeon]|nr:MAG: hypothetical protein JSV09_13105 [Thermoplasmata archaeon]
MFGVLIPLFFIFPFGFMFWMAPGEEFFTICFTIIVVWILIVAFLTFMLYQNTVIGLDQGNFHNAKKWALYGAIMGFFLGGTGGLGIITFIIFLISYISFDEAVWPKPYYYPPPGYYPFPPPYYGPQYPPQPSGQTTLCPNCRQPLKYMSEYKKWYCNTCKIYVKS